MTCFVEVKIPIADLRQKAGSDGITLSIITDVLGVKLINRTAGNFEMCCGASQARQDDNTAAEVETVPSDGLLGKSKPFFLTDDSKKAMTKISKENTEKSDILKGDRIVAVGSEYIRSQFDLTMSFEHILDKATGDNKNKPMIVTLTIARPSSDDDPSQNSERKRNCVVACFVTIFCDILWMGFIQRILGAFAYATAIISDLKSGRGFQWFLAVTSFVLTLLIVLVPDEPWSVCVLHVPRGRNPF